MHRLLKRKKILSSYFNHSDDMIVSILSNIVYIDPTYFIINFYHIIIMIEMELNLNVQLPFQAMDCNQSE